MKQEYRKRDDKPVIENTGPRDIYRIDVKADADAPPVLAKRLGIDKMTAGDAYRVALTADERAGLGNARVMRVTKE